MTDQDEARARILVVDDEEIVHASIKRILSRLGHEVDGAMTAAEGLKKMAQGGYDAIITDLMMPEMNGLEMLEAMAKQGIKTPVIMVTGYPTIKTAIQAMNLGAVDYVPKPFTRKELLGPLNRAVRSAREADAPTTSTDRSLGQAPDEAQGMTPDQAADGQVSIQPQVGDRFVLPEHSWLIYGQDGLVSVGIEPGFLRRIPAVDRIEAPAIDQMVEQGLPGFTLTGDDEVHEVFMPLSGRVRELNRAATADPAKLSGGDWLIKVLPADLEAELALLRRG